MCNCAWLLLLHATAVYSFDGLVQLRTQKYITSRQRGVHLHPPYPPLNPPLLMVATSPLQEVLGRLNGLNVQSIQRMKFQGSPFQWCNCH